MNNATVHSMSDVQANKTENPNLSVKGTLTKPSKADAVGYDPGGKPCSTEKVVHTGELLRA